MDGVPSARNERMASSSGIMEHDKGNVEPSLWDLGYIHGMGHGRLVGRHHQKPTESVGKKCCTNYKYCYCEMIGVPTSVPSNASSNATNERMASSDGIMERKKGPEKGSVEPSWWDSGYIHGIGHGRLDGRHHQKPTEAAEKKCCTNYKYCYCNMVGVPGSATKER